MRLSQANWGSFLAKFQRKLSGRSRNPCIKQIIKIDSLPVIQIGPVTFQIKQKAGRISLTGRFNKAVDNGSFLAYVCGESILVMGSARSSIIIWSVLSAFFFRLLSFSTSVKDGDRRHGTTMGLTLSLQVLLCPWECIPKTSLLLLWNSHKLYTVRQQMCMGGSKLDTLGGQNFVERKIKAKEGCSNRLL